MRPAPARRRTTPIVAGDVRAVSSQQRYRISDLWRAVSVHARQSDADRCCDRKAKGRAVIDLEPDQLASLEREIAKLRKINAALMSRVERSTDQQLNAFSLFETAISLDQQVRSRTQQLKQALQSLERTNGYLSQAKQQAEAASSLKSSVLISVTHDLLQPLNAARLTLSALAEMMESKDGTILVVQVDRSLVTLEDMLRSLLEIAKLDAGALRPEVRPIAIALLFETLRREFAPAAEKQGLSLKIGPSSLAV